MITQENTTREKFNSLKKYYDETWDEQSHTLHVGLFQTGHDSLEEAYANATQNLVSRISSILPITTESTILDVGCGTGRTLIEICEKFGCHGVGIDLSDAQINDAVAYLGRLNAERVEQNRPMIKAKFIQGSASELETVLEKSISFTHVISQDAIMLVANKQSLFENVHRLMQPGGVLAVTDFLSEVPSTSMPEKDQRLVYSLINWTGELSQEAYLNILNAVGLTDVSVERHDSDMILTYQMLADKMQPYTESEDKMYKELQSRYQHIVDAVKRGKLGWGLFLARKPGRKTALIAGTKKHSIGRYVALALHTLGWEIWLYSRNANKVDDGQWHERLCDITSEENIKSILEEIPSLDLVMMLADTGGHGELTNLTEDRIKSCIGAKIVGSVLLAKQVSLRYPTGKNPTKLIWCAGKTSAKQKDLILYSFINAGIDSFIEGINRNYAEQFQAYYLTTSLISPSTLGDEYIHEKDEKLKSIAKHPQTIVNAVNEILAEKFPTGMVKLETSGQL